MQKVSSLLQKLGCTKNEAETFLQLFGEPQGMSVLQLGKKLNLPRPTVYGYLNTLVATGLVKRALSSKGGRFYAESAERVASIFTEKADEFEFARISIERELRNATNKNHSYDPKLFVFDQSNAAELVLRDIIRSRVSETCWFWPIKDMLVKIPAEVHERFHRDRVARGMKLRVLWPQTQRMRLRDHRNHPELLGSWGPEALREIRILPAHVPMLLGYGIYGSRVGFIGTKREHLGFVVDSPDLSGTLKSQFDYWWSISMPLK